MSQRFLCGDDLTDTVRDHGQIVVKMKRRMKMMMDVTERHVDLEVMETVDQMKSLCHELDSRYSSLSKFSSSLHSLDGVPEVNKAWLNIFHRKKVFDPEKIRYFVISL